MKNEYTVFYTRSGKLTSIIIRCKASDLDESVKNLDIDLSDIINIDVNRNI